MQGQNDRIPLVVMSQKDPALGKIKKVVRKSKPKLAVSDEHTKFFPEPTVTAIRRF